MRNVLKAYQHLSELLATIALDDDGTTLCFQDLWEEQTEYLDQVQPFGTPALFYDFQTSALESIGGLEQLCTFEITLYLVWRSFLDTDTEAYDQEGGLSFLEALARIHDNLQGYNHPDCGSLNRVNAAPFRSSSTLRVYSLTYSTTLVDNTPMDVQHPTTTITMERELTINKAAQSAGYVPDTSLFDVAID